MSSDQPFKTYEVTTVKRLTVATITEENIGQIAKTIGGIVDYSGERPVLRESDGRMRWTVGMDVSPFDGGLSNSSGFKTGQGVTSVREVPDEH
ncbi:hypothetical protein [Brachybacterium nesterenkovii]|uniref:hypothetical protein n=1 Tax=Brachybacterium nesterenkovii TaxID=47847 RepID=UPI00321C0F10